MPIFPVLNAIAASNIFRLDAGQEGVKILMGIFNFFNTNSGLQYAFRIRCTRLGHSSRTIDQEDFPEKSDVLPNSSFTRDRCSVAHLLKTNIEKEKKEHYYFFGTKCVNDRGFADVGVTNKTHLSN